MLGRDWGALAMKDGGRRSLREVRRGQTERRDHENARKKAWRTRKDDRKLGRELTEVKMRRSGRMLSAEILAALFGENYAAAGTGIG